MLMSERGDPIPDFDAILRERFGFSEFRPGQRRAIEALFTERRLICIQPTGHGKSLLYQLPAVVVEGMTLVISPLLALVRDQMGQLRERFDIAAAAINSDQSDEENDSARRESSAGRVRILFVAPEQLDNLETHEFLANLPVDLLVVDEAHCVSTWGHDFRPSYRQIVNAVHELENARPSLRVLGLTATADRRTEADITEQFRGLDGRAVSIHREPMDRPNLSLGVVPVDGLDDKLAILDSLLGRLQGCGMLYCATREQTEIVAGYLAAAGHPIVAYHAGLPPDRKRELQNAFTGGAQQVVAATNALGMGIDKSDIRYIIHVDMPGSITAYYQEVGRAGRDGEPATGWLLFDAKDQRVQQHFIRSAQPDRADFDAVLAAVSPTSEGKSPNRSAVTARCGLHPTKAIVVLAELMEQGFVEKCLQGGRQVYVRLERAGGPELTRYERQRAVRTAELEAMLSYGRRDVGCLMQTLRQALGDDDATACGRCSVCEPGEAWKLEVESNAREAAQRWLLHRPLPIPACRRPLIDEGVTLLDGGTRSTAFAEFMRRRADPEYRELSEDLAALLGDRIDQLGRKHTFKAVVPLPSRTWVQCLTVVRSIADRLGAPLLSGLLEWKDRPEVRQGELLNNDQRRQNVHGKMVVRGTTPNGAILLVDDYYGSFATLREAARALRSVDGFEETIVPFTVARVRWRLGARGMI